MRRAARVDNTQADIVKALRMAAMTVQPLHTVGKGVPDLLVGWRGRNVLLEVKTGNSLLTHCEAMWREKWGGQYAVVCTPDEAVDAVLKAVEPQHAHAFRLDGRCSCGVEYVDLC